MRIQGIEKVEPYKRESRCSRVWKWMKENALFCAVQGAFLACAPVAFFFSAMVRGYQAVGGEVIIILAPAIYKVGRYFLEYDEREDSKW